MTISTHITGEGLAAYIGRYHEVLDTVSGEYLSEHEAGALTTRSLLPATIICYVSTQFGLALEYRKAETTTIEYRVGSNRVEDLVLNTPDRLQHIPEERTLRIAGSYLTFKHLVFLCGPLRLASDSVGSVIFENCFFQCPPLKWYRHCEYIEFHGDRRLESWSLARADTKARDEVLRVLSLARRRKPARIQVYQGILESLSNLVVVAGAYDTEGKKRLDSIIQCLPRTYDPIIIGDVPDFEHYTLLQKFVAFASQARFIIIDDTAASGHLQEFSICENNQWITIVLRAIGQRSTWTSAAAAQRSRVIHEAEYDPSDPTPVVNAAVEWAEALIEELRGELNELYPWRHKRGIEIQLNNIDTAGEAPAGEGRIEPNA